MRLTEITAERFSELALASPQATFYQTPAWAALKRSTGWSPYYLELDDGGKCRGLAMVLARKVPHLPYCFLYAPRGFLIDYADREALAAFTGQLRDFAQKKRGIFVKIDPAVPYKERDGFGRLVAGGYDNSGLIANLKALGYRHHGLNLYMETLRPRWMMVIDTKGRTIEDIEKAMEARTRYSLRLNKRNGIQAREISRGELPEFARLMSLTSKRRGFVEHSLAYYQEMWDALHDQGMLKVVVAEMDFGRARDCALAELKAIAEVRKDREDRMARGVMKMNPAKLANKLKEEETAVAKLNKQLAAIAGLWDKYGPKVIISGTLFLTYGHEVLSMFTGNDEEFMAYQASYCVYYWGIRYAVDNHYDRFNFYGITGDFSEANPEFGLYEFKRGFGSKVVELIGEFDLVINRPLNALYHLALKALAARKG